MCLSSGSAEKSVTMMLWTKGQEMLCYGQVRRRLRSWFFLSLGCFLASIFAIAQTTVYSGSIQGVIVDPSYDVVTGAKVTITNKAIGLVVTVNTNSEGTYTSGALIPGDYTLVVAVPGFKTAQLDVAVKVGITASGNIKLQAGQVSQVVKTQIDVTSAATEQATVQQVATSREIENLPLNGPNFLDLAQLEPGIQTQDGLNLGPTKTGLLSLSFDGRYGRSDLFELDGQDITNEVSGTTTQNIPASDVQQFQLQQSMLNLSTGLTSTGSVNVTTKYGTNRVHGEAFGFFRDQSFDANLPGGTHNRFQRNQFGGNVGGPIIKDKAFFFVDIEHTKQDFLDTVLPWGNFSGLTGTFNSPFRETNGSARIDWQIHGKYHFFYRFAYDQNRDVSAILPMSFQPFNDVNHVPSHAIGLDFVTGQYTHSFRFGYMKFRNQITDATAGSSIFNPAPGVELAIGSDPNCLIPAADTFCSGPSYLAPQQTYQSDHQFTYNGSRVLGSHIISYGGGWNRIMAGGFSSPMNLAPAVSALTTSCSGACLTLPGGASNPLNYPAQTIQLGNGQGFATEVSAFGFPGGGFGPDNRISAYIGDSWKVRTNFTLTYGMRYVRDTWRTDSDLPTIPALYQFDNLYFSSLGNSVRQPNRNFAPQLGMAWDPSGKGTTVVRGGIGLFYESNLWKNLAYDRMARLQSGRFLSTPTVCNNSQANLLTLPNGATQNWSDICGKPIASVIPQILANQAAYQAASNAMSNKAPNPSFVGTSLADGMHVNGAAPLYPNYLTPRSVEMNFGIQHELRPGTVFTMDVLRNVESHSLLAVDTNHVGDARFFNTPAARNAILATASNNAGSAAAGCPSLPLGPAMVTCYLAHYNANYTAGGIDPYAGTISDFAANGLDSGYALCGGQTCPHAGAPYAAFGGVNPALGANQMLFPIGRAVDNAFQVSLKQHVDNPYPHIKSFDLQISYQLQRNVSNAADTSFASIATDFNTPLKYLGPNGLDRTHQISFGGTMDLPFHFRFGMIGHFYSGLPLTVTLPPTGLPGGIFVTDVTGDGTGDGSFASNGAFGDVLPGTNIGSYGHTVKTGNINNYITTYDTKSAGQPTPAGQTLIGSGLITQAQLTALGGVQPVVYPTSYFPAPMGWLRTADLNLSWVFKYREYFTIEPAVSVFNVANIVNFDGPSNPLSGVLQPLIPGIAQPAGYVNTTSNSQPASNRIGLGSGAFALGAPRQIEFSMRVTF